MLSDEEKKAVNELKEEINKPVEVQGDKFNTFILYNIESAKTILNLIEKQSKEIEEYKKQLDLDNECEIALNSKVMDLEKEIEELKETLRCTQNSWYEDTKIIDKIKAKIEEYDDKGLTVNLANRSAGKTFQQAVHYEVKKVLQLLLEKE